MIFSYFSVWNLVRRGGSNIWGCQTAADAFLHIRDMIREVGRGDQRLGFFGQLWRGQGVFCWWKLIAICFPGTMTNKFTSSPESDTQTRKLLVEITCISINQIGHFDMHGVFRCISYSHLLETETWWRSLRAKPQRMERRRPASWQGKMIRLMMREKQLRLGSVYPTISDGFHRCRVVGLGNFWTVNRMTMFFFEKWDMIIFLFVGGKGFMLVWSISVFFMWTILNCKDFVFISSQFGSGKLCEMKPPFPLFASLKAQLVLVSHPHQLPYLSLTLGRQYEMTKRRNRQHFTLWVVHSWCFINAMSKIGYQPYDWWNNIYVSQTLESPLCMPGILGATGETTKQCLNHGNKFQGPDSPTH